MEMALSQPFGEGLEGETCCVRMSLLSLEDSTNF